jgi:hypothetical protein
MAVAKRGKRRITINDRQYLWSVCRDSYTYEWVLHVIREDRSESRYRCYGQEQPKVTPSMVRELILDETHDVDALTEGES